MKSSRACLQDEIGEWVVDAFGEEEGRSIVHRGIRFLEEALEAAQAAGVPFEMALNVITYVYGRPSGELAQELGGVGITVLALANAAGLNADEEEIREAKRVLSKPLEHFRQRNSTKNQAGLKGIN